MLHSEQRFNAVALGTWLLLVATVGMWRVGVALRRLRDCGPPNGPQCGEPSEADGKAQEPLATDGPGIPPSQRAHASSLRGAERAAGGADGDLEFWIKAAVGAAVLGVLVAIALRIALECPFAWLP